MPTQKSCMGGWWEEGETLLWRTRSVPTLAESTVDGNRSMPVVPDTDAALSPGQQGCEFLVLSGHFKQGFFPQFIYKLHRR